jgi:hypothetical protein
MSKMPKRTTEPQWLNFGKGDDYFNLVHRPLQCLIFITPLLIIYQVGITLHPWNAGTTHTPNVIAFILMLRFFNLFGVAGNYFPLLAVVAILFAWHWARKDPWQFRPLLYIAMYAESLLWAVPMLVAAMLLADQSPAMRAIEFFAPAPTHLSWQTQMVLSIGAGVYEELLFRLVLITVLNFLLVDVFKLSLAKAIPIIIITSAVLFSLYHYLGAEKPAWDTFLFRTAAGIYFAAIYIFRGFGIDVGSHAAYDVIVVLLQMNGGHGL